MNRNFILLALIFQLHWIQAQSIFPLNSNWQFREDGTDTWYAATVPGTVHTDLMAAGKIPDPFYGTNESLVQWVEEKNWDYRCVFNLNESQVANKNTSLVFDGIDTYADIFLNGILVLQTDNMFRQWETAIDTLLRAGENILTINFTSPLIKSKQLANASSIVLPVEERVYTRKAQYHYGWDWGPRLVTSGIWLPVYLQFKNDVSIENIQVITDKIKTESATVTFNSNIFSTTAEDITLEISDEKGNTIFSENYLLRQGENNIPISIQIQSPKLWWSHDLGEPYLYNYTIQLFVNDQLIEKKKIQFGIRKIELITTPDSIGTSFYFKLNNQPVFMRGANFIPTDNFLPRTTDSSYLAQLLEVKNANMNMLRIWGGGIYEKDIFYDLCDSLGILVWQDFMFACAMYPGDSNFISNVKNEINYQVKRLRNHPSIALWCGNNEIDEAWNNWGWQVKYNQEDQDKIWSWYNAIFDTMIPNIIASEDGTRSYWPSSPSIGWGRKESLLSGDVHYWGVWWGNQSFDYYNEKVGRFMSEYGFQGMPSYRSFKKFTPEKELKYNSPTMKAHQKHPVGYETILTYLKRDYKSSTQLETFIYTSQLLQAKGIATAIEAHRRSMPYCMGTLFWQMNDCWPVTSWSAIDYYGNRKALYYVAKTNFAPMIISLAKNKNALDCFIINNGNKKENITAIVEVLMTNGSIINADTLQLDIPADSAFIFFKLSKNLYTQKEKKVVRVRLIHQEEMLCDYFKYLVPPKDLQLKKPEIEIDFQKNNNMLSVKTNVFTSGIYLYTESEELKLSDNFFDLVPGETKYLHIEGNFSDDAENILYKSLNTIR